MNEDSVTTEDKKEEIQGMTYKTLMQCHPEHDRKYFRRLRALFSGGRKLLNDFDLMKEVFPPHRDEHSSLYAERCKRAFFVTYCSEIIQHLVAALCATPVGVQLIGDDDKPMPELPEYWKDFVDDCSPPGGEKASLQKLLREQILNALQVKRAWTLIDLPRSDPSQYSSLGEQEKAGALDVYAVLIETECVLDWEEDKNNELEWAVIYTIEKKRKKLSDRRDIITESWLCYDRDGWQLYEFSHKDGEEVRDDQIIPVVDEGVHPFGRVPLVRFCLPDGLWAMDKLEGAAREHFNKRSALSWAELQSLLPELYEFLGPEVPGGVQISENQTDPGRATKSIRGQGYIQERGQDDKAAFIGPDSSPFSHAIASCSDVRDEMHRVMLQMALSTDNSAAAVGRSADSKAKDQAATSVILGDLGQRIRDYAVQVMEMAAIGRSATNTKGKWRSSGADKFDTQDVSEALEQGLDLVTINIPSPTFKRRLFANIARLVLGPNAANEDIESIISELEKNVADEEDAMPNGTPAPQEPAPIAPSEKPTVAPTVKAPKTVVMSRGRR